MTISVIRPMGWTLACGLLVVALSGCGPREPGSHASEQGAVVFWRVTGTSLVWGERCTDSATFRGDNEPPAYDESSFLVVRISDDGDTAVQQVCDTTDPATCTDDDNPEIEYEVDGSMLVYAPDSETTDIDGTLCDLEVTEMRVLEDFGETATYQIVLSYELEGPQTACDAHQQAIVDDSQNGEGLHQCEVTVGADLAFEKAAAP